MTSPASPSVYVACIFAQGGQFCVVAQAPGLSWLPVQNVTDISGIAAICAAPMNGVMQAVLTNASGQVLLAPNWQNPEPYDNLTEVEMAGLGVTNGTTRRLVVATKDLGEVMLLTDFMPPW